MHALEEGSGFRRGVLWWLVMLPLPRLLRTSSREQCRVPSDSSSPCTRGCSLPEKGAGPGGGCHHQCGHTPVVLGGPGGAGDHRCLDGAAGRPALVDVPLVLAARLAVPGKRRGVDDVRRHGVAAKEAHVVPPPRPAADSDRVGAGLARGGLVHDLHVRGGRHGGEGGRVVEAGGQQVEAAGEEGDLKGEVRLRLLRLKVVVRPGAGHHVAADVPPAAQHRVHQLVVDAEAHEVTAAPHTEEVAAGVDVDLVHGEGVHSEAGRGGRHVRPAGLRHRADAPVEVHLQRVRVVGIGEVLHRQRHVHGLLLLADVEIVVLPAPGLAGAARHAVRVELLRAGA
mmetsp:Transcript_33455/g.85479  ORF Transcript_33455/g.85479 Transcript_33455/m.85479 type:complete len:339 (-) Transcript_33455:382-1398(-)